MVGFVFSLSSVRLALCSPSSSVWLALCSLLSLFGSKCAKPNHSMNAQHALDNNIPITFRISPVVEVDDAKVQQQPFGSSSAFTTTTTTTTTTSSSSSSSGGAFTHGGMLEFTAEEGMVGLPPKIARTLSQHLSLSALHKVTPTITGTLVPHPLAR